MGFECQLKCDACGESLEVDLGDYVESSRQDEFDGPGLFQFCRDRDWWYWYSCSATVCNDCLKYGPWVVEVTKEQYDKGQVSEVELRAVIELYGDPDDTDFLDWFVVPNIPDLTDELLILIASEIKGILHLSHLTTISSTVAEALAKHEGDELLLDGLTELSDAAAESLSRHEGEIDLSSLTTLSDAAAVCLLSKNKGSLCLNGRLELSDALAESLGKHQGDLWLNGLTELTDAAVESLCKREGHLSLCGLTSLSAAAAESLSKHKGHLDLGGLTELSDAAAHHLVKHLYLDIGLDNLPESAAQIFRQDVKMLTKDIAKQFAADNNSVDLVRFATIENAAAESLGTHEGHLRLDGLTSLSDAAAESLSKHEGWLWLDGLTELSDAAAESLANKEPKFASWHLTLDNLPASAAKILRDAGHG